MDQTGRDCVNIGSLNCAGLVAHIQDIRADDKLLQANVLHLQETSLLQNSDGENVRIDGFCGTFQNHGRGKGVATYNKLNTECLQIAEATNENLQIVKFKIGEIESINIYRSSNKSTIETSEALMRVVDTSKPTLITGDFNVCLMQERKNVIIRNLEREGFQQLVRNATHIEGGHIDHVYWLDKTAR